jgi:hypothetical protein
LPAPEIVPLPAALEVEANIELDVLETGKLESLIKFVSVNTS